MGQDWTLFNLDKYEAASCTGIHLGSFFFDGEWETYMVNLLLNGQPNHDSWGGDRLVLLGDYARGLPPDTVTDDDPDLLKMRAGIIPLNPNRKNDHIYYELEQCSGMRSVKKATYNLPEGTVYALRSLNKKDYIRHDIVMDYRKYFADVTPGLTQALYTRVGWSDNPSGTPRLITFLQVAALLPLCARDRGLETGSTSWLSRMKCRRRSTRKDGQMFLMYTRAMVTEL